MTFLSGSTHRGKGVCPVASPLSHRQWIVTSFLSPHACCGLLFGHRGTPGTAAAALGSVCVRTGRPLIWQLVQYVHI